MSGTGRQARAETIPQTGVRPGGLLPAGRGREPVGAATLFTAAVIVTALWLALAPATIAQLFGPSFPTLTGQIVDEAGLIRPEDRAAILGALRELEGKSTDQVVVVTLKSLQGYDIADYGYRLGRHWGIGQAGKNNGILLLIAPNERKVRIEVGRGLEPVMTDTMSGIIVNNALLPAFRRGDFSGGIAAAARDIKDVLLGDAAAVQERAKGSAKRSGEPNLVPLLIMLLWIAIFVVMIWFHFRQSASWPTTANHSASGAPVRRPRDRRRGFPHVIVIPGGRGSWGGWSGGGGDGGGWSGGGGDFGGGGSSGSW